MPSLTGLDGVGKLGGVTLSGEDDFARGHVLIGMLVEFAATAWAAIAWDITLHRVKLDVIHPHGLRQSSALCPQA